MVENAAPNNAIAIAFHRAAYKQANFEKNRLLLIGLTALVLTLWLTGWIAEVSLTKWFTNLDKFTSYFYRIFHLDTGAWVISNPTEWFWG